jgi:hypothetical protein
MSAPHGEQEMETERDNTAAITTIIVLMITMVAIMAMFAK